MEERNGSQGPPSVSLVGRVERTGQRASPLGEVVDVETPRRPLANTSCPLCQLQALSLHPLAPVRHRQQGLAMTPHPTSLLGLALWGNRGLGVFLIRASLPVLCLGQMIHMQNGLLPRPSIRAEPGPVVARGRPVTILCRGPAGVRRFRLEQKENTCVYMDQKNISQRGSLETEARFLIPAVSEVTAVPYRCAYLKGSSWSERSEALELKLTDEEVPVSPSEVTSIVSSAPLTHTELPSSAGLSAKYVYILIGVSVAFLLCLLLLVFLLVHRQHQKKHGPLSNKGEEQRPQERLSPAVDTIERTPDVATVDKLPEKDREMHTPAPPLTLGHIGSLPQSPAAGDPQEVTYAQLDHRTLTLRAARAVSSQAMETTADSSTYAAITRR
ncbi:leukocyte-associated immunoglobulin-like receptor 1 isoform 3-T3 [Hipposideros larvatus]